MSSENWKNILDEEPDNELVRFSYAKALLEEKNYERASKEFKTLLEIKPDYALAWSMLARSRLLSGDKDGAREACREGLPVAKAQRHEIPLEELEAVLRDIDDLENDKF